MTAKRIRLSIILTWCGLLACPTAHAQEAAKSEKVRFATIDGVELHGNYYAAGEKKKPVVLLLHALGEDSRKATWVSLAGELSKAGLNVLSFDFRGHGQSVDVEVEKFWGYPHNQNLAGGRTGVGKQTIDVKNFHKSYLPTLVNDIAAARAFLERTKNDIGDCSTSSIIVIGAETGGTLGAVWMASEWFRFKLNPPVAAGLEPTLDSRPEGKDIIGAVFLSLSPKLADRPVRLDKVIHVPGIKGNTPMLFMYGEEDAIGKKVARACETYLKKEVKNRYTTAFEIKGSKLAGAGLLQKSLGTEKLLAEYLGEMVEAKKNEWSEREFKKTAYFWKIPGGFGVQDTIIPLKPVGEMNLAFDTFDKFVP